MTERQLTFEDVNEEYKAFVDKFKPKLTTDDCYTPENIYIAIRDYVCKKHGINPDCIVRPFWPGGDYERYDYPEGCVVLDNPPFSILSKIVSFYVARGIKFYLFGPGLTLLNTIHKHHGKVTAVFTGISITYGNGAIVNTAYCHNLYSDETAAETDSELGDIIKAVNEVNNKEKKKKLPKLQFPDEIITGSKFAWFAVHHVPFSLHAQDCVVIKNIDNYSKGIFGGGICCRNEPQRNEPQRNER